MAAHEWKQTNRSINHHYVRECRVCQATRIGEEFYDCFGRLMKKEFECSFPSLKFEALEKASKELIEKYQLASMFVIELYMNGSLEWFFPHDKTTDLRLLCMRWIKQVELEFISFYLKEQIS